MGEPGHPGPQVYDRWFLLGDKCNELLALWEVQQYGRDSFGAPPWGHALSDRAGLDLRRTQPPVAEVIDITTGVLGNNKLLFAVQGHETVEPDSPAEVTTRFPWSAMTVYDINAAGQNHGLLLATWGWAAT